MQPVYGFQVICKVGKHRDVLIVLTGCETEDEIISVATSAIRESYPVAFHPGSLELKVTPGLWSHFGSPDSTGRCVWVH